MAIVCWWLVVVAFPFGVLLWTRLLTDLFVSEFAFSVHNTAVVFILRITRDFIQSFTIPRTWCNLCHSRPRMSLTDLTRNAFQSGVPPAKASAQDTVCPQNSYLWFYQWVSLCQMFLWRGKTPHSLALTGSEAEISSR